MELQPTLCIALPSRIAGANVPHDIMSYPELSFRHAPSNFVRRKFRCVNTDTRYTHNINTYIYVFIHTYEYRQCVYEANKITTCCQCQHRSVASTRQTNRARSFSVLDVGCLTSSFKSVELYDWYNHHHKTDMVQLYQVRGTRSTATIHHSSRAEGTTTSTTVEGGASVATSSSPDRLTFQQRARIKRMPVAPLHLWHVSRPFARFAAPHLLLVLVRGTTLLVVVITDRSLRRFLPCNYQLYTIHNSEKSTNTDFNSQILINSCQSS